MSDSAADKVIAEVREAVAYAWKTGRVAQLTGSTASVLLAIIDDQLAELERLREQLKQTQREREEWADAIRSVAPGRVGSAGAAKHAIAELKELLDKSNAERLTQSGELARKELKMNRLRAELDACLLADEERRKLTGDALHAEGLLAEAQAENARLRSVVKTVQQWAAHACGEGPPDLLEVNHTMCLSCCAVMIGALDEFEEGERKSRRIAGTDGGGHD